MRKYAAITLWLVTIILFTVIPTANEQLYMSTVHHLYRWPSTLLCLSHIYRNLWPSTPVRQSIETNETTQPSAFPHHSLWCAISWILVWPIVVAYSQQLVRMTIESHLVQSIRSRIPSTVTCMLQRLTVLQCQMQHLIGLHDILLQSISAMISLLQPVASNFSLPTPPTNTLNAAQAYMYTNDRNVLLVLHDLLVTGNQLYGHISSLLPRIRWRRSTQSIALISSTHRRPESSAKGDANDEKHSKKDAEK
jgi:hypothetical protein